MRLIQWPTAALSIQRWRKDNHLFIHQRSLVPASNAIAAAFVLDVL